jgi:predicted nucleotidyltransferase
VEDELFATMQLRGAARDEDGADDPLLAEITRRLAETLRPERIYLFGSRARGDAQLDSDYDLLVLVPVHADRSRRLAQAGYHALRGIDAAVDVLVMSVAFFERRRVVVASLPATVEREGKLLYAA